MTIDGMLGARESSFGVIRRDFGGATYAPAMMGREGSAVETARRPCGSDSRQRARAAEVVRRDGQRAGGWLL